MDETILLGDAVEVESNALGLINKPQHRSLYLVDTKTGGGVDRVFRKGGWTMKVINLFGSPGAGKSTTAAGLFHLMKNAGLNVELVTEFAKDLVWEAQYAKLQDQLFIIANQNHRLARLQGKVDWAITDSPLLLPIVYGKGAYDCSEFREFVRRLFFCYDNYNVFLGRTKPYNPVGRVQTAYEANELAWRISDLLNSLGVVYRVVPGDMEAPQRIIAHLNEERGLLS